MTMMLRYAAILSLLIVNTAPADDAKPDKIALDGTYTITKGESGGKEIPAERLKGSIIKFDGDKILGTDKDKKDFFATTFKIDTSATPNKVMMVSTAPTKGQTADGIIEVTKDSVKLCYALPGGDTPTEFKTKAKQNCFELKRIANKTEK